MEIISNFAYDRIEGFEKHRGQKFSVPLFTHVQGNLYVGGTPEIVAPPEFKYFVNFYDPNFYRIGRHQTSIFHSLDDVATIPERSRLNALVSLVETCMTLGPTLVHCQAGLNRSPLIVALLLIQQGGSPPIVIDSLRSKRCSAVLCNETFESFLRSL